MYPTQYLAKTLDKSVWWAWKRRLASVPKAWRIRDPPGWEGINASRALAEETLKTGTNPCEAQEIGTPFSRGPKQFAGRPFFTLDSQQDTKSCPSMMLHVKSTTSKSSKVKQRGKPPRTGSCLSVFAVVPMNHTNASHSPQPFQQLQHPYNCHVAWWSLCHRWRFRNHSCKHWKLEVAEIPRFTSRLLWRLLCRFLGGDE